MLLCRNGGMGHLGLGLYSFLLLGVSGLSGLWELLCGFLWLYQRLISRLPYGILEKDFLLFYLGCDHVFGVVYVTVYSYPQVVK